MWLRCSHWLFCVISGAVASPWYTESDRTVVITFTSTRATTSQFAVPIEMCTVYIELRGGSTKCPTTDDLTTHRCLIGKDGEVDGSPGFFDGSDFVQEMSFWEIYILKISISWEDMESVILQGGINRVITSTYTRPTLYYYMNNQSVLNGRSPAPVL